jgi:DNA protecting protein DprA
MELLNDRERLAILSLWAVPGIGPKTFAAIVGFFRNDVTAVLRLSPLEWVGALNLSVPVREMLSRVKKMSDLGECMMERARRANVGIAFPGDPAFPPRLVQISDPPPVLFFRGTPSAPRRRIAMVGSRHPDQGFLPFAQRFASEVAEAGVGIISGAAMGVDQECHWGAIKVKAETWAFVGSALDELDPPQAKLLPHVVERGGMFYTELPLGIRASTTTFPRRNRLISGAADAVLVLRAGRRSGALHTAHAAVLQGRPLLAMPGDADNETAFGCNGLIRSGHARLCLTPQDAWAAVGVVPGVSARPPRAGVPFDPACLSDHARIAYGVIGRVPLSLDDVLDACQLPSGSLISALCELELMGLVVQHPGRRYERI